MIIVNKSFRTVVHTRNGVTMRVCTGEELKEMHRDDVSLQEPHPGDSTDVAAIYSRKDVFQVAKNYVVFSWAMCLCLFVSMTYSLWKFFMQTLQAGVILFTTQLPLAAFTTALFTVYFSTVMNPIVHDNMGHWVNLRTGSSNLCDGITVRRKARWP